jgi:excisionase family DNA binding protein
MECKYEGKILKQTDLYEILPFKKDKIQKLIKAGELPVVRVGKDYITTYRLLEEWIEKNIGGEIYF